MKKATTIISLVLLLSACGATKQNPATKCSFEASKQISYNKR